jgi:hypothetical protein
MRKSELVKTFYFRRRCSFLSLVKMKEKKKDEKGFFYA